MEEFDAISKKRKRIDFTVPSPVGSPEVKVNDTQFSVPLDNDKLAGFQGVALLNPVGLGTGGNQRVGRVVKARALWLNYVLYRDPLASNITSSGTNYSPPDNIIKLSIVWDKQGDGLPPGGGAMSTISCWYNNVPIYKNQNGYPTNVVAQPNVDWRDRMIVLWEGTTHTFTRFDAAPKYGQVRLELDGLRQLFTDQNQVTAADIQSGGCYLVVQALRSSAAVPGDRLDMVARYYFEDN